MHLSFLNKCTGCRIIIHLVNIVEVVLTESMTLLRFRDIAMSLHTSKEKIEFRMVPSKKKKAPPTKLLSCGVERISNG